MSKIVRLSAQTPPICLGITLVAACVECLAAAPEAAAVEVVWMPQLIPFLWLAGLLFVGQGQVGAWRVAQGDCVGGKQQGVMVSSGNA
jgi:hypothetical protein